MLLGFLNRGGPIPDPLLGRVTHRMAEYNVIIRPFNQMTVHPSPVVQDHVVMSELVAILKGFDHNEGQGTENGDGLIELVFSELIEF